MSRVGFGKVLLTGVNGQVGRALNAILQNEVELITATRTGEGSDVAIDLANHAELSELIKYIKPSVVINPAAYTQVDRAEDEPQLAQNINGVAPGVIAEACKAVDAVMIHYSTDYVFDGKGSRPYRETDETNPINCYGASKLAGENAIRAVDCRHLIFRTCWVYDRVGKNFPNAILAKAETEEVLKVVDDQIGTPTSADYIARVTFEALMQAVSSGQAESGNNRIYNLKPEGWCSWYEFAKELVAVAGIKRDLVVRQLDPVPSEAFPTKAARPSWSVLDNSKLLDHFQLQCLSWQNYMEEIFAR